MGKLFFGTQTGTSQGVSEAIQQAIQQAMPDLVTESKNIYGVKPEELSACDFLVLGGSTWGDGELSDDWADYLPQLSKVNFAGKKVALFSLGDQVGYSYNFVSAMKLLYDEVKKQGGEVICTDVSIEGFEFEHSESVIDGKFIGLVIDEVNEPHLTADRIQAWVAQVRLALNAVAV